jgi:two-component system chemotaxis response regulator CheB
MSEHDIIVIGGSAGGIETLINLVGTLPGDFPGAIFVVIHFPAVSKSYLPQILTRSGSLPAKHPMDGEKFQPGVIYVAPPNSHLLLSDSAVHLSKGPKEHGLRPSVDSLFRTAAQAYGPRVVGVVLSGTLYDGAAGAIAIKQHGGLCIAQDPEEALYPGMPMTVIEQDHVDYVLPALEIGVKLIELSTKAAQKNASNSVVRSNSMDTEMESTLVQEEIASFENGEPVPNKNTILTCPECGGVLWHLDENRLIRYRCHVGHTFSEESLLIEQSNVVESALWSAVRVLEEKAALAGRMAAKANDKGFARSGKRFSDQAEDAERSANIIREMLLSGKAIASLDNLPEENIKLPPLDEAKEESLEPTDQPIEDT